MRARDSMAERGREGRAARRASVLLPSHMPYGQWARMTRLKMREMVDAP